MPQARGGPRKKPASRTARADRLEEEKVRRSLRRRLVVVGVALAILAVVIVLNRPSGGACTYDTVTDADPPAGGDVGDAEPAEPGFYTPDDELPADVSLIKSMRQGFVVLWYEPSQSVDQIQPVSDRFGRDLIVVPRAGLPKPFTVTAWEHRMLCDAYDEDAVVAFTEERRDNGPEKGFL